MNHCKKKKLNFMKHMWMQCHYVQTVELNYGNMNKIVQEIAERIIEEVDEHIDNTIHWQLEDENIEGDDLYELELQIKQQLLFSLIKNVTK